MNKSSYSILSLVAFASLTGCGFAVRSPEMYRDDTQKVLETKSADIKACYDGILQGKPGVGGRVTVKFEVEPDTGKIKNVTVDQPNSNAPPEVGDCVKRSIEGLAISPPDANLGQAAFVYEFSQPPPPPAPPPAKT
ncbi:MAG: AgmX/PglI C-terminal domain-containing protein [Labilithrix sp.]|nr:AgmX/PglI C-terminal domain-containing protein [Labilithrix sp.]MCW5815186.1 AgmX/PglI C-terminal domain-containing protein [Labilithrix sp.]